MNLATKVTNVLVIGIALSACSISRAQSFLEKLEQTVREGLKQPQPSKKNNQQGELPAPAARTSPAPPAEANPVLELPGNSVLESPIVPAPTTPEGATAVSTGSSGYLGLEAEPVVGGGIGVRVVAVAEGSPAWKAGFKIGDVILGIDGHAIADLNGMVERLSRRFPGEPVNFLVLRGGRNVSVTAVLQDTSTAGRIRGPLNLGSQLGRNSAADPAAPAWLGLAVSDLSSAFRLQFGISAFRGAAVTSVATNSPAETAKIKPGDAIVEINGQAVDSSQDVLTFVARSKPGQVADMLVFRGSTPRQMQIVLGVDPRFSSSMAANFLSANSDPAQADPGAAPESEGAPVDLQKEIQALREELRKSREQLDNIERRMDQLLNQIAQESR